jgi:maleate isomerase
MESKSFENPVRIGILTPSSNTVLEPVTHEMTRGLNDVSVHFSRLRVT